MKYIGFETACKNGCKFAAAVGILGCAFTAGATTITDPFALNFNSGSGTLAAATGVGTLSLNETINTYNSGYWQVLFSLPNAGEGATNYTVTKTVTNNTSVAWEDFLINVGCGNFGEIACAGAGVFFDLSKPIAINESAHAGAFLSPAAAAHSLHWINMNVAPTQSVTFTFDLQTCANCAGGWAIFQQPSLVPEAGSAVMLSAGLLALIAIVRRRNGRESMG